MERKSAILDPDLYDIFAIIFSQEFEVPALDEQAIAEAVADHIVLNEPNIAQNEAERCRIAWLHKNQA